MCCGLFAMPQGCIVPNCTSRYGTAEKVSMYRFPLTKPKLVKRWLQAIKKPNWEPTKNSRICCHHFEDNCFWIYNGRSALTPFAVPTKFDTVPRELKQSLRVNGQHIQKHIQNARKPWNLPSQKLEKTETENVTQDFVYIKTEPDLYLSEENEFTIKAEPQSEPETEINYDVGQIKIEDSWGSSEQEPMPIVFPVVKEEIKEEPEDNTYSLPPSNFARLSSPSVAEAKRLNPDQHNKINKTTQEVPKLDPILHKVIKTVDNTQQAVQRSPKKQRVRKRRRPREEGLLSDHTYVKLKLGCQIKVGSVENDFSHDRAPSLPKYSHVSVQCGESVLAQNALHVNVKTQKKTKVTDSKMGYGSGVGRNLSTSEVLKSCDPEVNMKKIVKTGSPGSTKKISKFPSVTFSNNKCKIGLVLSEKQGKLQFCKNLSETFKNDLKSKEKECPAEEDCNKENALSTVIKRDFLGKPHNVLDVGHSTKVKNECLGVGDCKMKENIKKDQKFLESFPLKSCDIGQKFVTSTSLKQRKINNSARRNLWRQRKKKLHGSLLKRRRLVASVEANLTSENKMIDREVRSCSNGQTSAEEKFMKKEVIEPHLCLLCEESFACQDSLRIHVAKHCQKSAFACIHCAKTFVDAESLRSHIATHVLHKCVLCSAELPSKSALCEHVLSHFGESVLKCEHCPKTFYGTKLLEEHQLLHAAMSECVCRTCKKVVGTEIEYFEHMKSHLKVQSVSESSNETVPFVETAPVRNGIQPTENKTIKVSDKYVLKNGIVGERTVSESRKTCIGFRTRTARQPLKADNETTKMDDNRTSVSKKTIIRGGLLCAICCEVCITEAEYREHVLRHERVSFPGPAQGKLELMMPVKCMLCEKKFANERVLKKHILVHTGEFQQSCAIVQGLDR